MDTKLVILAGATGDLGGRIAGALRQRAAEVRAIVRPGTDPQRTAGLRQQGVEVVEADIGSPGALAGACAGGDVVVSALSGLRPVIVEGQTRLLEAAVAAGVRRFIPSDFAIDFAKTADGHNRNLDLRREFMRRLDRASIQATSILNGMFMDLLTGQAPFILFKLNRVLFWKHPAVAMDFTTIQNTAEYTAAAALDADTPRWLRIAGDVRDAHGLVADASAVTGREFSLLRAGGLGRLRLLIGVVRTLAPMRDQVFPPWQGMQYTYDMFDGAAKLEPLDNDRYPEIGWTTVRALLAAHTAAQAAAADQARASAS